MNAFSLPVVPNHFIILCWLVALLGLVSPERLFHLGHEWWRPSALTDMTQRKRYVLAIGGFIYTAMVCAILPLAYSPTQIVSYLHIMWQVDPLDNGAAIILLILDVLMLFVAIILGVHYRRRPTTYAKYVLKGKKYYASGYVRTEDVRRKGGYIYSKEGTLL